MIRSLIVKISGLSFGQIDRVAFWTFILVIVTFLLWWVGKKQLGGISKTAKADFIKKFSDQFFSKDTQLVVMLFDYNALSFRNGSIEYGKDVDSKPFPYFVINENVVEQFKIESVAIKQLLEKKYYSSYEVDDCLLGFFEDLGSFEKKRLIDIEGVYNAFDWYMDIVWNNEEIKKYMKSQNEDEKEGDDIYEDFKYIYEKCDSYGKAKLAGKWIWWWKIKWIIDRYFLK
jgi:hypothetical protein